MATKINSIQAEVLPGGVLTTSWMESRRISRTEQTKYVKSGWLVRLGKGVYRLSASAPTLFGTLASLSSQQAFRYHIGASTALELQGYSHYVSMGRPQVYLFTSLDCRLPGWIKKTDWQMDVHESCSNVFGEQTGITTIDVDGVSLAVSSPELALMECLLLYPEYYNLMDVYYLMESLTTLRSSLVSQLLEECSSVKVKRLFLYMAEKAGHPWFKRLNLANVSLGSGPRSFAKGGVKVAKYNIVIPKELAEYE